MEQVKVCSALSPSVRLDLWSLRSETTKHSQTWIAVVSHNMDCERRWSGNVNFICHCTKIKPFMLLRVKASDQVWYLFITYTCNFSLKHFSLIVQSLKLWNFNKIVEIGRDRDRVCDPDSSSLIHSKRQSEFTEHRASGSGTFWPWSEQSSWQRGNELWKKAETQKSLKYIWKKHMI